MDKNKNLISLVKNAKLKDVGHKPKKMDSCCSPVAYEDRIQYPNIYLNSKNVPDLKGYEVGDECTFLIKGKITMHDLHESRKGQSRETFDIEIHKIATLKSKDKK